MRLHIQNLADDVDFPIGPEQWAAALARHPDITGIAMSMASDDAGFAAGMADAEVLLTWSKEIAARLTGGALPGIAPHLQIVSVTSAGVDRLAPFGWLPDGVALLNNRGTHGAKAGEYGIMALLMLANHVPFFAEQQRERRWTARWGSVLAGRSVGVVGLGGLGSAVAMRARQFGMRVLGVRAGSAPHEHADETHAMDGLDAVLPRCEFLVLACPLTEATRGLLSRERLALLPQGAKLVNIGRGALWDEDALCDLLEAGRLGGCVTDVTVQEPLPEQHRIWRTPGLFLTPHMSSDDPATYNDRTLDILFANLRARREGRPMPNRVDPARGY